MPAARIGFGDDLLIEDLLVYPNPSEGRINIQYSPQQIADLHIYDATGRLIFDRQRMDNIDLTLDLEKFGRGMYLLRVTDGYRVLMKKVLID